MYLYINYSIYIYIYIHTYIYIYIYILFCLFYQYINYYIAPAASTAWRAQPRREAERRRRPICVHRCIT